jgi:hypothetical protein
VTIVRAWSASLEARWLRSQSQTVRIPGSVETNANSFLLLGGVQFDFALPSPSSPPRELEDFKQVM